MVSEGASTDRSAQPALAPGLLSRLVAGAQGGAVGGLIVGLLDGGLRVLGIDPGVFYFQASKMGLGKAIEQGLPGSHELPNLLGCWAWTGGLGLLIGAALGGVIGAIMGRVFGQRPRLVALAGGLVAGLWLGIALFWWSRPIVLPGLPMDDPKRLAAAAAMVGAGLVMGPLIALMAGKLAKGSGRIALVAGLLLALGGGLFVQLGFDSSDARGATNERNQDLPNVVVFIVDALRQDSLGCYGNTEITTPNIDALAEQGVVFEEAFAQAPYTWPSFGSFLTAKYPRRHGLIQMDLRMPQNVTLPYYLAGAEREDGTRLEDGDFVTSAIMTGTVSHGSGLLRGFDYYYEALVGHDLVDVRNTWSRFRSGLLPALIKNKITQRFDDGVVSQIAKDWILERKDQRFLSMVHLYSTHTTYAPAEKYLEPYADPSYEGPIQSFSSAHVHAINLGDYEPSPEDVARVRALYAGGVSQADAHIGVVVDAMREAGVLDNTIVVVTSDHGESLGEAGFWEHNWMLQSNLRIPLIMRFPAALPAGQRVTARADSIDMMPTLLDIMGLQPLPAASELPEDLDPRGDGMERAQEAVDGVSLMPVVHGEAQQVRPYSFAENGPYRSIQDDRWKLVIERTLLEKGKFKSALVLPPVEQGEHLRLYDLQADPDETNDLAREQPKIAIEYVQALREYDAKLPIRSDQGKIGVRDLDQEERLKSLGYSDFLDGDQAAIKESNESEPSDPAAAEDGSK